MEKYIQSKFSNFNKFASSLDLDKFVTNNSVLSCYCTYPLLIGRDHEHTLARDLRIITNNRLRQLFTKGSNHRKSMSLNFRKTTSDLILSLITCMDNWCTKHDIYKSNNSVWKDGNKIFLNWQLTKRSSYLVNQKTVLLQYWRSIKQITT